MSRKIFVILQCCLGFPRQTTAKQWSNHGTFPQLDDHPTQSQPFS